MGAVRRQQERAHHGSLTLPGDDDESPRRARDFGTAALMAWGVEEERRYAAKLIISECATNALRYTHSHVVTVEVEYVRGRVMLGVTDQGPRPARPLDLDDGQDPALADLLETGRGLPVVAGYATFWGTKPVGAGTRVWARLDPPDAAQRAAG